MSEPIWKVYCSYCGTVMAAEEEVEDDVCPRCGHRSCLSGRYQGYPPIFATEADAAFERSRA